MLLNKNLFLRQRVLLHFDNFCKFEFNQNFPIMPLYINPYLCFRVWIQASDQKFGLSSLECKNNHLCYFSFFYISNAEVGI